MDGDGCVERMSSLQNKIKAGGRGRTAQRRASMVSSTVLDDSWVLRRLDDASTVDRRVTADGRLLDEGGGRL